MVENDTPDDISVEDVIEAARSRQASDSSEDSGSSSGSTDDGPRSPGGSPSFPGTGGSSSGSDSSSNSSSSSSTDDGPRSPGGSPSVPNVGGGSDDGSGDSGGSSSSSSTDDGPRSPGGSPSFPGTGGSSSESDEQPTPEERRKQTREEFIQNNEFADEPSDVEIDRTNGEFSAELSDDARKERALTQFLTSRDVDPSDVTVVQNGSSFSAQLTEEARRERKREELLSESDAAEESSDVTIVETDDGLEARVTEEARREQTREEFIQNNEFADEPDDVEITEQNGELSASLSAGSAVDAVREEAREQQLRSDIASRIEQSSERLDDIDARDITLVEQLDDQTVRGKLTDDAIAREVAEERPNISATDLEIEQTEQGREITLSEQEGEDQSSEQTDDDSSSTALAGGDRRLLEQNQSIQERERAVEQVQEEFTDQTGIPEFVLNLEAGDEVNVEQTATGTQAELSEEFRRSVARSRIDSQLEQATGAELDREDIQVERTDQGFEGSLTEEGETAVEVQNTPLADTPLGGLTTSGTRVRRRIRGATDPVAEGFRDVTPSRSDVAGLLGASAAVAAAEPTPIGEGVVGAGLLAGGAAVAGGAAAAAARGEDPEATARAGELDVGGSTVEQSELGEPDDPQADQSELQPGEPVQQTEIDVPEERTTVAPEELGIPRDAVQDGDATIRGPEGTEITDEGDIVIPAGTTQATGQQLRFEEEEEEEEEDEDEEEEEEEDEEDQLVPDELLPDEEVVIGVPEDAAADDEGTADQEQSEAPAEESVEGVDDAAPEETQEGEDFAELVEDGEAVEGVDDVDPTDRRQEETDDLLDDGETQPATPDTGTQTGGVRGTLLGPGGQTDTLLGVGGREREQTETDTTVDADVDDLLGEADAQGDLTDTSEQTGQLDATAVGQPTLVGETTAELDLDAQTQTLLEREATQQTTQAQEVAEPAETLTQEQRAQATEAAGEGGSGRSRLRLPRDDGFFGPADEGAPPDEELTVGDGRLVPGFFNEFVVARATQGGERRAPEQEELEAEPLLAQTAGTLPTERQLDEDPEVEDEADFLAGIGNGLDVSDGGGGFGLFFGDDQDDEGGFF